MEKSKKQALFLSIVAVVTLITLVVGATFAYFKAQGGTAGSTEVKVTTYTTDMLTFTTGSAISLYADQSSFGQEKGSLSGETFAKATLVANNKTNEATDNYYVYFNIENNTFKYTLGEDKPELILTVTGPDGSEVTSLPGLTYKTVQDRENKTVKGFDVTTMNGLITVANKKTITATPNAEEQYTLKLTLANDTSVIEASGDYFYWVLAIPLCGFSAFLWDGIFIGATATRQMLYSMLVASATFFIIYYLFYRSMGNHALWMAFLGYLSLRGGMQWILWRYRKITMPIISS